MVMSSPWFDSKLEHQFKDSFIILAAWWTSEHTGLSLQDGGGGTLSRHHFNLIGSILKSETKYCTKLNVR